MSITVNRSKKGVKIILSPTLDDVDKAAEEIKSKLKGICISKRTFDIVLGIREALINAVKHGNNGDKNKNIICEFKREGKELTIKVFDEGDGFNWRKHLIKDLPSKEDSGRGIAIMKEYFNIIKFNEKGNQLTLKTETK